MKTVLAFALVMLSGPAFSQYSGQYGCTEDCSGHEAGYAWAEAKGIDDPGDCRGKSQSFIEGCQDFAEQQQEEGETYVTEDGEECDPDYDEGCQAEGDW